MRHLAVISFLWVILVTACATDVDRVPPISVVSEIRLAANAGWSLSILPDGSGAIGYGSSGFDFAPVPVRTFDFKQVYRALAPVVRASGNMRESFTVVFSQRDVTTAYALYTDNADVVLDLFATAKLKCDPPGKARIDELWERRPLSRSQ